MNKIKQLIISTFALATVLAPAAAALPQTALQFGAPCRGAVLTFPTWYRGLNCDAGKPQLTKLNDVWIIALNIVEMLIGAAIYAAVGYITWGGFKYIKSQGDPGKISEAKSAIINASIGLGIGLSAVAIVRFVQGLIV